VELSMLVCLLPVGGVSFKNRSIGRLSWLLPLVRWGTPAETHTRRRVRRDPCKATDSAAAVSMTITAALKFLFPQGPSVKLCLA